MTYPISRMTRSTFRTQIALTPLAPSHPPRILLLYGSLRQRSYSRFLTLEAERLLQALGAETRVYDPAGLAFAGRRRRNA